MYILTRKNDSKTICGNPFYFKWIFIIFKMCGIKELLFDKMYRWFSFENAQDINVRIKRLFDYIGWFRRNEEYSYYQ